MNDQHNEAVRRESATDEIRAREIAEMRDVMARALEAHPVRAASSQNGSDVGEHVTD
nr:hypothetical protein [Caballeronia sp. GAFFF1]